MGTGNSSLPVNQHRTWSVEPPPLPAPPFFTGVRSPSSETSAITRDIEDTAEDLANKTTSASFDGPSSQGPSPYTTLRRKGCWQHEPSSPTPPNSHSRQDSLLAYAPEITSWPPSGRMTSEMQQERMDLTRTVSHLAAATQQLASAQNVTLMHLEAIYDELKREREAKKNLDQYRRGMNNRVSNLEPVASETLATNTQRKTQKSLVSDLRDHLDNAVSQSVPDSNEEEFPENIYSFEDRCELSSRKRQDCYHTLEHCKVREAKKIPRHTRIIGKKSVASKIARKLKKNDQVAEESSCGSVVVDTNEMEVQDEKLLESESYQCSRNRNEEASLDLRSDRLMQEVAKLGTKKRPIKINERINRADVSLLNLGNENCPEVQEIDDSKATLVNARLKKDLEAQQRVIEKLNEDYEISRREYKVTEESLIERTDELSQLSKKFDISKREIERLMKELETFQYEKAATDSKISKLELDLLEGDRIRREEFNATNSLRSRLLEESSDKNKSLKALEDAREEIKKLKQTIEADKEHRNSSRPGPSRSEDSTSSSVVGEEFKKELTLKREARQRAIAAVSSEMDRLRRELDAEKVAHSETSKILELLKAAQSQPSILPADQDESKTHVCNRCSYDIGSKVDNDLKKKEEAQEDKSGCMEAVRLTDLLKISEEVMNNIRFQLEKADDLYYQLENVPEIHKRRISSLKNLADDMRETLRSRERQVNLLKDRLSQILVRLGDRTFLNSEDDIRVEYSRQIEDLLNLRRLYEERLKVFMDLKDSAIRDLKDVKRELNASKDNIEILEKDLRKAEEKLDVQDTEISNLESQLGLAKADCRDLQNQMSVINNLFTQMLLGASSADMDLDRLTQLLQENHDLISDMTRDSGTEAAALPKLLLDLIEQVEGGSKEAKNALYPDNDEKKEEDDLQEENIAHNLPKVWRVLLELIRCHVAETSATSVLSSSASDCCYKSVDTPTGPQLVISVSKTYIRLKELILEKKHLEKEMNRMKQLNTHLECKLGEQEKRLSTVSDELSKTWNIVSRMQAQHQQLHTHEKILRYELQQKRKMLQELKQELEYCREKWESARQKNTNTEIEWRSLRREFAARKALAHVDSLNNSAESGFSDERDDESDEEGEFEDETIGKRVKIIGSRRRGRKGNSRNGTPDTESEQPTDTEVSESKTVSSSTSEQHLSTTDEERIEERIEEVSNIVNEEPIPVVDTTLEVEMLDPLDRALTNVIRNLIKIDDTTFVSSNNSEENQLEALDCMKSGPSTDSEELAKSSISKKMCLKRMSNDWTSQSSCEVENGVNTSKTGSEADTDLEIREDSLFSTVEEEQDTADQGIKPASADDSTSIPLVSVFSIGPFLTKNAESATHSNLQTEKLGSPLFGASINSSERSSRLDTTVGDNSSVQSSSVDRVKEATSKLSDILDEHNSVNEKLETNETNSTLRPVTTATSRSPDEVLAARAARLKRLEEQADWLVKKMNATSRRGSALSTRLEELHETYGSPPCPPPIPDVLPTFRLQTEIDSNLQELSADLPQTAPSPVRKDFEDPSSPDDVP